MSTSIISGMGQGTTGIVEGIAGSLMYFDAMDELDYLAANRPVYEVPPEIQEMVNLYSKEYAQSGRELQWEAGARERQAEMSASNVASARESATSASDLLSMGTDIYSNERRALADLEIEAARQREENRKLYSQLYGSALETSAQYKDKAFNWNEAMKYQEEYNRMMDIMNTGYDTWQMGAEDISASFETLGGTSGGDMASMFG